jgi:hypothetical protein
VSTIVEQQNLISRREFTLESALALLAGVTITVSGCGGSSPAAPTPPPAANVEGVVGTNHGHAGATVTGAQITAAGALSLNIQGTATHPHTVALTGAQLTDIGARRQVVVTSSTDAGHAHTVTFN